MVSREWLRINEGETFFTISGISFTYEMREGGLYISRIKDNRPYTFTCENLDKALEQMPVSGPSAFDGIWGHPYCYGILKVYDSTNKNSSCKESSDHNKKS